MKYKVVIAVNSAWNLVNFRSGLIRALVDAGHEVLAVAPADDYAPRLAALGCRFIPLPMDNKGTHPGRDLLLLWRFWRLLRKERPSVYLGYTVKPNVYGSIAAHALNISVINNIAGLGAVFIKHNWVTSLVRGMYRLGLSRSAKVFFQNDDDRAHFIEGGLVRVAVADRVPGSGVDLVRFSYRPALAMGSLPPGDAGEIRFLLIARMLWSKGVGEYVKAARMIKRHHPYVEFCLLGFLDVDSPDAISRAQMDEWVAEGAVKYLGVTDDIRPFIADADCVVLPSYYREGTPRTLLEAAAIGRSIVTTDTVGCRDVVDDGVNGYLCRTRDPLDLVDKLMQVIALGSLARSEMGRRGREKVEREFDEKIVIRKYLEAIREIADPLA